MSAFVLLVAVVTASTRAHRGLSVGEFAASPERIGRCRLWLLLTSALDVEHPIVLSLGSVAVLGSLVMLICGPHVFLRGAPFGQVASTLLANDLHLFSYARTRFGPLELITVPLLRNA